MPTKKKVIEVVDVANSETTIPSPITKRKYTKKTVETERLIATSRLDENETIAITNKAEPLVTGESNNTLDPSTNSKEPISNPLPDGDSEDKNKKKSKSSTNTQVRKGKQQKVNVQDEFYERVIVDKIQVTIHLNKIKVTGVITHHDMFCILLESNGQQQVIYKQTISFISAPMRFRKPFVRRDKPFYNTNENTTNQTSDQATAIASQSSHSEINFRENTYSNMQTPKDKTENRPAKTYSSFSSSNFQITKPNTDKSRISSNNPITEKSQVQSQTQSQKSEQKPSTQQIISKPNTYSKAANNQQNQASKDEPNKAVKVFRVQSSSSPTTKPKK